MFRVVIEQLGAKYNMLPPLLRSCDSPIVLEIPDGHAAAGIFYGYKKGFYSTYHYTSISRVLIIHCQLFPELIQLPNVKHIFATLFERVLDIGKRITSK